MRSLVRTSFEPLRAGKPLRLFRSYHSEYKDGGQKRDFVYVDDCVDVILWMLDNPVPSDLYNVGSGQARTWLDLGRAMFAALNKSQLVEFIDMPRQLIDRYQYFTQADISKLRAVGFTQPMTSIEEGVRAYVAWLEHETEMGE